MFNPFALKRTGMIHNATTLYNHSVLVTEELYGREAVSDGLQDAPQLV